ncbi:hypothetical protein [Nonomuraea sp. bgisy101]|uniref:hypothetical protein n=1 Tax=Nonomuraea sp. bgisy101 TaxID=3413784 RepID=UPI003D7103EB
MYLPDRAALERLADALMETLHEQLSGRGEVVIFAAGTVARIGEVFGVRVCDIDARTGTWTVRALRCRNPSLRDVRHAPRDL